MRRVTAQAQFASSHKDEACGPHPHGHTFHVIATELGSPSTSVDLFDDLAEVVAELHLHSLDDMLPAVSQDLGSMSSWIMERLTIRHPGLVTVDMWTADRPEERIGAEREIRR